MIKALYTFVAAMRTAGKSWMTTGKAELLIPSLHPVNLCCEMDPFCVLWDTVGAKHWGSGGCGGVTQISQ